MITQSEKYIVRVNSSVLKNPKYRAYLTLRGNSINSSYKSGATTDRSRAQKYHSVESAAKAVKHLLLTAKAQSDEYREDLLKGARIYSYSTDEIIGYVVDIIEDLENRKENEMKGKGQMSNARDFENDPNPMGRVLKNMEDYIPQFDSFSIENDGVLLRVKRSSELGSDGPVIEIDGTMFLFDSWDDLYAFGESLMILANEMGGER